MGLQGQAKQVCAEPWLRSLRYVYPTGESVIIHQRIDARSRVLFIICGRYSHGRLVEINSHSLFSKWFSESGKLVQKLFARVTEMVEDESGFVVVLIGMGF